jgi:uncharacterized protein YciI
LPVFAVVGRDGADPSRRAAFRDRHIAAIEGFARDGTLLLGLPLHAPDGRSRGSLMIVAGSVEEYLAREPFASGRVWAEIAIRPLRIPSLPWRPWPSPDAPPAPGRGHTILFAAGKAAPGRLGAMAARGDLIFAATTRDAPGAILVTTHRDDTQATAWIAAEPALTRCEVTLHATLFRPLPYRPLSGRG